MTTTLETRCPFCGRRNELHDAADGSSSSPKDGDVSFCIGCGQFGIYDLGLIRQPSLLERRELYSDPAARRVLYAWQATQ